MRFYVFATKLFELKLASFAGLIFCSIAFGLAIEKAQERGLPLLNFFRSTLDVVLIVLSAFMWWVHTHVHAVQCLSSFATSIP